jgi:hypothetical protein
MAPTTPKRLDKQQLDRQGTVYSRWKRKHGIDQDAKAYLKPDISAA